MVRLFGLLVLALVALMPRIADADGEASLRLHGRPNVSTLSVSFDLTNHTNDELVYTTYDGGHVHNDLERLDGSNWVAVGIGYCGLGRDGEVSVAAGGRQRITGYIDGTPGSYRATVHLERRTASGMVPVAVVSPAFTVP